MLLFLTVISGVEQLFRWNTKYIKFLDDVGIKDCLLICTKYQFQEHQLHKYKLEHVYILININFQKYIFPQM